MFKDIAGLKINYFKWEISPLPSISPRRWLVNPPFTIAKEKIKYLGINVGKHPSSLYSMNYTSLIDKIVKKTEMWKDLPLSLLGRIHLFKMSSFSKLLYPLQTSSRGLTSRGSLLHWLNFCGKVNMPESLCGGCGYPGKKEIQISPTLRHIT